MDDQAIAAMVGPDPAGWFEADYSAARQRFLDTAARAGLTVQTAAHPETGPVGEPLAVDWLRFGPDDARGLVFIISGTHGAEGFVGSAMQSAMLASADRWTGAFPDTAFVLVHAACPFGMAWQRRESADNSDLLRNLSGHRPPHPPNPVYAGIDWALNPAEWHGPVREAAEQGIRDFIDAHGKEALIRAVKQGQYLNPKGILYHGTEPSWECRTLDAIAREHFATAPRIAIVDVHTGFGAYGEAICICPNGRDSLQYARLERWFGAPPFVTGDDPMIPRHHVSPYAVWEEDFADREITGIGLEFGTFPSDGLFERMRADNWLFHHGDRDTPEGREISAAMARHCYPRERTWMDQTLPTGLHVVATAARGLRG